MMSQDHMLKLDAVLSTEQMRALLQEAGGGQSHSDKLDFDVLGHVGSAEDGSHPLAAIEDTFHDLETLVLEQGSTPGSLFTETSDADVEALLKATLGTEDLLSPIDLVLLDHCYCLALGQHQPSHAGGEDMRQEERGCASPCEEGEEGFGSPSSSPGSPQLPLRRSQRQIERIDRERLERIKAENAELKRREQEEMERLANPVAPVPAPPGEGGQDQEPQQASPSLPPQQRVPSPLPEPPAPIASPLPQSPASARTLPVTLKERVVKLGPQQASPIRKGKTRNSESFSSDGMPEDPLHTSPSHSTEEPVRQRKKRSKSLSLDMEEKPPHEGPKRGVKKEKSETSKTPPHKKETKKAKEETQVEDPHARVKRKAEEADKESKKKKQQEVSPFGKVVKVVRTVPEVKKKARRESFTDEPALFSQPDVLTKEHEPQAVTTAAAPGASDVTDRLATHSEESSYDTVEAHVARLAGGDHCLPLQTSAVPVAVPTTSPAVTGDPRRANPKTVTGAPKQPMSALRPSAMAPKSATAASKPAPIAPKPANVASKGATVVHKPTTVTPKQNLPTSKQASTPSRPTAPVPKQSSPVVKSSPSLASKKAHPAPNAASARLNHGPDRKRPLTIAVKSAPPPPSQPGTPKPKHMDHQTSVTAPVHSKPTKSGPKLSEGGVKKGAEPLAKKAKVPKPEPTFPPVAERPKRQSKEKFKRAMMRKREMGRRVDDEDVEDSAEEPHDSDWSSEDDPEKLWCICRQPHNDKFMIQCDKCEDWFHGTCVGVTRQQGRLWEKENREWKCPKCAKALAAEAKGGVIKKEPPQQQRVPEEKPPPHSKALSKADTTVKVVPPRSTMRECLVCKRKTECVGLYCGRDCIAKYVNDASQTIKAAKLDGERRLMFTERSSGKLVAGVSTPTPEKLTGWLVRNPTYELAVARTPARASSKPPPSKTTETKPTTPAKLAAPAKQSVEPQLAPQPAVTAVATPSGPVNPTSTTHMEKAPTETSEPKKPEPAQAAPEPVRLNVRKVLRDSLSNRCKDADDVLLSNDEVKRMAVRIEEELFKYFKDTGTKYKSKYRSLIFNIKDTRNQGLFRKIVKGKIPPDKLVRMTPEELASKELARWRERENQHTLEMIKKEQMEAAQNVTSHALIKKTHKGEVEIDDDNLRLLEKADENLAAEQAEPVVTTPRVSVGGVTTTSSTTPELPERPSRDTTDEHRAHLFDLNCKICTGKVAPPTPLAEEDLPGLAHSKGSSTPLDTGAGDLSSSSSSSSSSRGSPPPPPPPVRGGTPPPPSDKKRLPSKRSREDSSDHEPSSTVSLGSPDSGVAGGSGRSSFGGKAPSSVWKGFISMQEVSKFVTSAYKVSGPTDFLSQDIPDTINVCGRIIPDQVWDYLSKIKQSGNKELLVIRFQPANEEEKKPYRELYAYLNSRKRCGVVGGLTRMLKDFYILPLPSHSPVPTVLMPFEGPGLMSGRPHMLLGIIVRHKNGPKGKSRTSWAERSESSFTPPPPETTPSGGNSDDEEPYEPSYTPPLEKRPRRSRKRAAAEIHPEDDDDVPYDPEDNDMGFSTPAAEALPSRSEATEVPPPPPPPPVARIPLQPLVSGQTVSDLIERISAGANPAEVTTSVLASIATNSDLEHQKRLLVELTQEVEEQKRLIELQRLQAIQMAMTKVASPPGVGAAAASDLKAGEASGIPFLDSSLPTDTELSFLSSGVPAPVQVSSGPPLCTLPSTLQDLLNKVKASAAPTVPPVAVPPPPSNVSVALGTLLGAVATPSPPQSTMPSKKPIAEDPIVKHFAGDNTPESDSEAQAAEDTPPPPGESPPDNAAIAVASLSTLASGTPVATRSPGTPTKDELVVEEARPQDPRRRKASALPPASTLPVVPTLPTPAIATAAVAAPPGAVPMVSTGSKLGAKSASELMEMARKQLEEMEGMAMPNPAPPPPPPPPVFAPPPPNVVPPPMMGALPPGMYGPPPPPIDPTFVPPPPQGMGFPPPEPQWGAASGPPGFWKGPPPPPGWNGGGGRNDYNQRGADWRGGGRRSQWDQRH